MQERLESSAAGRFVLSCFLFVTTSSLGFWNLPASELKARALKPLGPYVLALGLDQNWGVFAPDPPRQLVLLEALITYEDDSRRAWSLPQGDPFFAAYWDYRWRKYTEWVRRDNRRELWEPTAAWIARHEQQNGRRPVTVTLSRKITNLLPPGSQATQPEPRAYDFFTYSVLPVAGAPSAG